MKAGFGRNASAISPVSEAVVRELVTVDMHVRHTTVDSIEIFRTGRSFITGCSDWS